MAISMLISVHSLFFISALVPYQLRSSIQGRKRLEKAILHAYNDDKSRDNYRNSIPAHEQLLGSTRGRKQQDEGTQSISSFDTSPLPLPTTANVSPLKVMVFIDGTWLYYSIYERQFDRDVISQKLGKSWNDQSTPDWSRLPTVACQALLQDPKSKWSAIMPVGIDDDSSDIDNVKAASARPIEVSRVSVYSSMHRDTPKDSLRFRMFSEMMKAGFDVNMMETIGKGEKCVDIQLAVDMLYYATVPDAYDVALLLTGDKDFLPAVIRCRQKGKRIGLVSMRTGSLAFEVTPNLKDYDTIFLEDYLSQWIRNKTPKEMNMSSGIGKNIRVRSSQISPYTLNKVITNFIEKSGSPQVSSRDIGRHLKELSIRGKPLLDEIKAVYGGLYQFLILSKIYVVISDPRRAVKSFWVALLGGENALKFQDQEGNINEDEKEFLTNYEQWMPFDNYKEYEFTITQSSPPPQPNTVSFTPGNTDDLETHASSIDYNALTVPELKEICREKGLKISAKKKIELVQRIEEHMKSEKSQPKNTPAELSSEEYLKSLVLEYVQASGGQASSRDVGRYLSANKASPKRRQENRRDSPISALAELKEIYGSLNSFVKERDDFYSISGSGNEYNICIEKAAVA